MLNESQLGLVRYLAYSLTKLSLPANVISSKIKFVNPRNMEYEILSVLILVANCYFLDQMFI